MGYIWDLVKKLENKGKEESNRGPKVRDDYQDLSNIKSSSFEIDFGKGVTDEDRYKLAKYIANYIRKEYGIEVNVVPYSEMFPKKEDKSMNYKTYSPEGDPTKVEIDWSKHTTSTLSNFKIEDGSMVYKEPESNPLISKGGYSGVSINDFIDNKKSKNVDAASYLHTGNPIFSEQFVTLNTKNPGLACHNHEDDIVVYNIDDIEKKELLETIAKLTLENNNLKHEVEYLDKYIKYLEDNFHFVLKDCKLAKQLFGFKQL